MNDEYDEVNDIAEFMSAYVEFHTEPSTDLSYIPMTEEEAQTEFLTFLDRIRAIAWDEGFAAAWYTRDWSRGGALPYPTNPYRKDEA